MPETEPRKPRRRWRIVLAFVVILLVVVALALRHYTRTERLTALIIDQARSALGADLTVGGAAHYDLWPNLHLVLPAPSLKAANANAFIKADAIEVRVPWRILWADRYDIEQIDVIRPTLDLDALTAWLAARPASTTPVPDIRFNLHLIDGTVTSGWQGHRRRGQPDVRQRRRSVGLAGRPPLRQGGLHPASTHERQRRCACDPDRHHAHRRRADGSARRRDDAARAGRPAMSAVDATTAPAHDTDAFATALLDWYDHHGRKDLPWQQSRDAYRVWLSEVMLQQTQVRTVIAYFERFVAALPDLDSLARAPQDQVLALWSGLGYYSRARNLHRTAQRCIELHGGALPRDLDALSALPGIGRSTAAAILAQTWGDRHAILDGNVRRVLARWHGVRGWPGSTASQRLLWEYAQLHTPAQRVADYTQAIMDLGATLCTRSRPQCARCPVAPGCVALRED